MPPEQVVLFIIGSIVVIFAAYYLTYFIGRKASRSRTGRSITMRDRFAISKDKSFCLIEVKGKVYFVAMTNQAVALLDTINAEEFDTAEVSLPAPAPRKAEAARKTEPSKAEARQAVPRQTGTSMQARLEAVIQKGIMKGFNAVRAKLEKVSSGSGAKERETPVLREAREEDNLDKMLKGLQSRRAGNVQLPPGEDVR